MTKEPTEALIQVSLDWFESDGFDVPPSGRKLDWGHGKILAQALRKERERVKELTLDHCEAIGELERSQLRANKNADDLLVSEKRNKELEAQVAVMRAGVIYLHPDDQRHKLSMTLVGCLACDSLSLGAGKRHLDLDALKNRVVEAARYSCRCGVSEMPGKDCSRCEELNKALSALEAKEKE